MVKDYFIPLYQTIPLFDAQVSIFIYQKQHPCEHFDTTVTLSQPISNEISILLVLCYKTMYETSGRLILPDILLLCASMLSDCCFDILLYNLHFLYGLGSSYIDNLWNKKRGTGLSPKGVKAETINVLITTVTTEYSWGANCQPYLIAA